MDRHPDHNTAFVVDLLELVGIHPRTLLTLHGLVLIAYSSDPGLALIADSRGATTALFVVPAVLSIAWAIRPELGARFGRMVYAATLFVFASRIMLLASLEPPVVRGTALLAGYTFALAYLWPTLAVGMSVHHRQQGVDSTNRTG